MYGILLRKIKAIRGVNRGKLSYLLSIHNNNPFDTINGLGAKFSPLEWDYLILKSVQIKKGL